MVGDSEAETLCLKGRFRRRSCSIAGGTPTASIRTDPRTEQSHSTGLHVSVCLASGTAQDRGLPSIPKPNFIDCSCRRVPTHGRNGVQCATSAELRLVIDGPVPARTSGRLPRIDPALFGSLVRRRVGIPASGAPGTRTEAASWGPPWSNPIPHTRRIHEVHGELEH
jgi:hypothetical protein